MTEHAKTDLVIQGHVTDNKMRVYHLNIQDLEFGRADREVLRRLAGQVAELAARPIEDEKRDLWYKHNALEPTRPVIYVEPEDGWREIITDASLECQNIVARQWEVYLRKLVFSGVEMGDDAVIASCFNISHVHPKLHWGLQEIPVGGEMGGRTAITWEPPLNSYEEICRNCASPG